MNVVAEQSDSIFKHRHFRRYFVACCAANLGIWTSRFLLGWLAWDITQSAMWVGIASALMVLPAFLLAPFFGVLADRINTKVGMSLTLLGQGIITGLAALTTWLGWFSLAWLLGLALVNGAVASAYTPMRMSLVPQLVPRSILPNAIAATAVVFNVSRILGPALAGGMITYTTVTLAFSVSTLLFISAMFLILRISELNPIKRAEDDSVLGQLRSGLQFTLAHPVIRLVLLLTVVNALLGRTVLDMLPAVAGMLFDGSPATLAQFTATAGVGAIISSLIMSRLEGNEARMEQMIFASLLTSGIVVLLLEWFRQPQMATVIIFYLSLAATMASNCGQALMQLVVSDDFRGRVTSLWTVIAMGVPAIGTFIMGIVAEQFGFVTCLKGFAVFAILFTTLLYILAKTYTETEEDPIKG